MAAIIKFLLIFYIAYRVLGFLFRWAIRRFGYSMMQGAGQAGRSPFGGQGGPFGQARSGTQSPNQPPNSPPSPKPGNLTDKIGDYVDYEEVK